ncbi:MAG TPA: hypothetical protein VGD46_19520 [Rhizobacter sp.]
MTVKYQDPVNPEAPAIGDLRVWWNPQIGRVKHIHFPVKSVHEGARLLQHLARYDLFQLEHRVKGDYANVGGLQEYVENNGDDHPGWVDWEVEVDLPDLPVHYDDPLKYAAEVDEDPFADVLFAETTQLVYCPHPEDADGAEIPLHVGMTTGTAKSLRVLLVPKEKAG